MFITHSTLHSVCVCVSVYVSLCVYTEIHILYSSHILGKVEHQEEEPRSKAASAKCQLAYHLHKSMTFTCTLTCIYSALYLTYKYV